MSMIRISRATAIALAVAATFAAGTVQGDKPAWAGRKGEEAHGERGGRHAGARSGFSERDARVVHRYFGAQVQAGHCPPGLAKKRNGCLPPGQAKKWARGRPLPHGVVYHELPPALVVELGRPPAGHKYVRIAADILMIAVGTGMVVDAIEDLGRM